MTGSFWFLSNTKMSQSRIKIQNRRELCKRLHKIDINLVVVLLQERVYSYLHWL